MGFLITFLFSISANLDTLTVAIAYGMKKIKVPMYSYILIAVISTTGTVLSMLGGKILSKFISTDVLNVIGAIIIIFIGIWFFYGYFKERWEITKNKEQSSNILVNPEGVDKDKSGDLNFKESVVLSLGLTINNLGVGVAGSIVGLSIMLTSFITFILTILLFFVGIHLGKSVLTKIFGKYSSLISALLIIIVGIYELFI